MTTSDSARRALATLATVLPVIPAAAAELTLSLELPRLDVAEYHRPYVAMWIEKADQTFVADLAVWYDLKLRNGEGTKWLKDLRGWWRKSGRDRAMPVDGLSSATRAPGEHKIQFSAGKAPLASLPPGEYRLVVEAAREVGGREVVSVPFHWPLTAAATAQADGKHEIGAVKLRLQP